MLISSIVSQPSSGHSADLRTYNGTQLNPSKPHALWLLIVLLSIVCVLLAACSATPLPSGREFQAPEGATIETNVQVSMRDGARLNTTMILPARPNDERVPTILVRTPYKSELNGAHAVYEALVQDGYAVVMQNERGRYFSEGAFEMLGGARDDGWDTLDWIIAQSWSNGEVGTFGCSSSGENQLKLGSAHHRAHKAMVVGSSGVAVAEAGPFREQGNFWRGGVWQQGWMNYFHQSMFQHWPQLPEGLSDQERQRVLNNLDINSTGWNTPPSVYNEARTYLPMIGIMEQLGSPQNEVPVYLARGPAHPSWANSRISEGEIIKIPALWFESLYDISARSVLAYFEWNRQANAEQGRNNQQLQLTQGGHCSFGKPGENETAAIGDLPLGDMRYDYVGKVVAWFNQWLPSRQEKYDTKSPYQQQKAVKAFLGHGKWLELPAFPMAGNQTWHLQALGKLGQTNTAETTSYSYTYDPNNPVPSLGGEIYGEGDDHLDGSYDQRELHSRQDVLLFTSPALTNDTALLGLAEIQLTVSSNQPDTDFTVKINEVFPDGRAFNLGDTILRMRYRNGLDQPIFKQAGEVYTVQLPPIPLSRLVKAGHRLQVEVSSSNFPSYARNLNTAQDPYTSTDTAVAQNKVYVGGESASLIKLPIHQ